MKEIKLTENEQKILEELRRMVQLGEKPTIVQLADRLGVAPSSITKLAKKLGYSGWGELYYGICEACGDTLPLTFNNFRFLSEHQVFDTIGQLVDILLEYKDRRIIVAGVGDSEYPSFSLLEKLWQRGFFACRYSENLLAVSPEEFEEPGLCFFINESGIVLMSVCAEFLARNYKVLSITSSKETPLAAASTWSVEIKNKKSLVDDYIPNYFAPRVMIFLELLFVAMDERLKKGD